MDLGSGNSHTSLSGGHRQILRHREHSPRIVAVGHIQLAEYGVQPDGVHVQVREYIDDMPRCMAAADLVVSRCGALTLSELPAMKKPAVLVPSPYVAENHQYYNAMALADRGAAVCIEEKDLTDARLWDTIETTALDAQALARMGEAAGKAAVLDAHERIYAVIRDTMNS